MHVAYPDYLPVIKLFCLQATSSVLPLYCNNPPSQCNSLVEVTCQAATYLKRSTRSSRHVIACAHSAECCLRVAMCVALALVSARTSLCTLS